MAVEHLDAKRISGSTTFPYDDTSDRTLRNTFDDASEWTEAGSGDYWNVDADEEELGFSCDNSSGSISYDIGTASIGTSWTLRIRGVKWSTFKQYGRF